MDKGKSVREHRRRKPLSRRSKFSLHQRLVLHAMLLSDFLLLMGALLVVGCIFLDPGCRLADGSGFCLFLAGVLVSVLVKEACEEAPGTFWNPILPNEGSPFLDANLLVRASSQTDAQPAELLRAVQQAGIEKSEQLLRAGTEREA